MRRLSPVGLFLLLAVGCDDHRYLVGTTPAGPDGAVATGATGGASGQAGAVSGGAGGGIEEDLPPVPACQLPSTTVPDRPVLAAPQVLAARLARLFWSAEPDADLLARVATVRTSQDVRNLAVQMMADHRWVDGVDGLARAWLGFDAAASSPGADEVKGMVDPDLRASMVTETTTFVRELYQGGDGRLTTLLTAPYTFADQRVAPLYGAMAGPAFTRTELDPQQRSGILTQASFLFAKPRISGRGTWVLNRLLCVGVPTPPAGADTLPPMPPRQPTETDRQVLVRATSSPVCQPCHQITDPPGFGLGHYDALGRWRDLDSGQPIDASGMVQLASGGQLSFDGARQLGQRLSESCDVYRCVATIYLQRALSKLDGVVNEAARDEAVRAFVLSGLDLRALLVWVAGSEPVLSP